MKYTKRKKKIESKEKQVFFFLMKKEKQVMKRKFVDLCISLDLLSFER